MKFVLPFSFLTFALASCALANDRQPNAFETASKLHDTLEVLSPSAIHLDGWIGKRVSANESNRLLNVDTEPLLQGFRKKPGTHPWIGEHIGKWLHAATLAWSYTGDPRLKSKLDKAVVELVKAQEPDGYLGTYVPNERFGLFNGADWDVWSHKYNLIGLLTYYQYTSNKPALNACRKMGDLLIHTFGPGRQSILSAGTHMGMAATSVLEPIVLLYRTTGDQRYLNFAKYIVQSWDEPNGPRILSTLQTVGQVNKTANGKAYEMLSNLVGLCELARATGDHRYLTPVMNAWKDIVSKRLYLTGSASHGEHFGADYELPNDGASAIAETCVTTTWIQLNLQLLRFTGDTQYANELEKSIYNHLAAAQDPKGGDWCYYTPLKGKKPYDAGITCCHSSGPRGMALVPTTAYLIEHVGNVDRLLVNTYETSSVKTKLGGQEVFIEQQSKFPANGKSTLVVHTTHASKFSLGIRQAPWSTPIVLRINGHKASYKTVKGWATIAIRKWSNRDRVEIQFSIRPQIIEGDHGNQGTSAVKWGPFVMAYDGAFNPNLSKPGSTALAAHPNFRYASKGQSIKLSTAISSPAFAGAKLATFVPFADAGSTGGTYRVWLPKKPVASSEGESLLSNGHESRSRQGNIPGTILEEFEDSQVVTFDNSRRDLDWFAVTLDHAVTIQKVIFKAGSVFHDGGWFDSAERKPMIQVQTTPSGPWKDLVEIAGYPATTATSCETLVDPQQRTFVVQLQQPVVVTGIRVIGKPASGDNPNQAFASCAGLRAYRK